jgi:glycosyltransferase involved in cell wall biosynthesis
MKLARVDQLLAGFADGDAISQEAREFRRLLRLMGVESDIFAPPDRVSPDLRADFVPIGEFESKRRDGVIYHYGIHSPATESFLRASSGRRWVRYHNITPDRFFRGYDDSVAAQLREARAMLPEITAAADGVWADSAYNAAEISGIEGARVRVFPLVFSLDEFAVAPDPETTGKFGAGLVNWLFVGRIAPNKAVEELILAFSWYNRDINPHSRLLLPGSDRSCPRYYSMLRLLSARLRLANVCFEGFVSQAARSACYASATIFITASRHEGYCLPVIEAMVHGVPVLARNTGGIPEALGGAGVLFDGASPRELAVLADRLAADGTLREEVCSAQTRRMDALRRRDAAAELAELMS